MKMFDKEDILVKLCLTHEKQKIESEKKIHIGIIILLRKVLRKTWIPFFYFSNLVL